MVRFGDDLPPSGWQCVKCKAMVAVFVPLAPRTICASCGGLTFEFIRSQEPGGAYEQALERYYGG